VIGLGVFVIDEVASQIINKRPEPNDVGLEIDNHADQNSGENDQV
jgi:hypothetical protein